MGRKIILLIILIFSFNNIFTIGIVINDINIDEEIKSINLFHYEKYFNISNLGIPSFCNADNTPFKLNYSYKYTGERILSISSTNQFYFESNFDTNSNELSINNLLGEVKITSFNSFISSKVIIDNVTIKNYSAVYSIISVPGTNVFLHVIEGKINVKYNKKSNILIAGESIIINSKGLQFSNVNDLAMARIMIMYNFYLQYSDIIKKNNRKLEKLKLKYQIDRESINRLSQKSDNRKIQKYVYLLNIKTILIQNTFINYLLNSYLKKEFNKSIQDNYYLWKAVTRYTIINYQKNH